MLLLRFGTPPLAPWLRMLVGNSGLSMAGFARGGGGDGGPRGTERMEDGTDTRDFWGVGVGA